MKRLIMLILLAGLFLMQTGCGGGGGGGGGGSSATQAAITINLSGTGVFGTEFTLNLPAGVTVSAASDGVVNDGVITGATALPSGQAQVLTGVFTASNGTVHILFGRSSELPVGALLVVNANLASGTTVTKDSFTITNPILKGSDGATVSGASLSVASVTTH